MPAIPVTSTFGYIGIFCLIAGSFIFLAGLSIISIEKIKVKQGREACIDSKSWNTIYMARYVETCDKRINRRITFTSCCCAADGNYSSGAGCDDHDANYQYNYRLFTKHC